ncbi:MAG TPA: hypothetical protein VFS00_00260, partial [Polyangiaceae bacterium]|nr:hypothetical protein [Polyangiaceae bacterium]
MVSRPISDEDERSARDDHGRGGRGCEGAPVGGAGSLLGWLASAGWVVPAGAGSTAGGELRLAAPGGGPGVLVPIGMAEVRDGQKGDAVWLAA